MRAGRGHPSDPAPGRICGKRRALLTKSDGYERPADLINRLHRKGPAVILRFFDQKSARCRPVSTKLFAEGPDNLTVVSLCQREGVPGCKRKRRRPPYFKCLYRTDTPATPTAGRRERDLPRRGQPQMPTPSHARPPLCLLPNDLVPVSATRLDASERGGVGVCPPDGSLGDAQVNALYGFDHLHVVAPA